MLHLTSLIGFGAGGKPPITGGFVSAANGQNVSSFAGMSFGTAQLDRYIVAVMAGSFAAGNTITGCTIGGVTATQAASAANSSGGGGSSIENRIFIAAMPSGASGTVAVSGVSTGGLAAALYALYGLGSPTAIAIGSSLVNPSIMTLNNLPFGSFVIAGSEVFNAINSWSGVTQDNSQVTGSGGSVSAVASTKILGLQNLTLSSSMTVTTAGPASSSAAWSP